MSEDLFREKNKRDIHHLKENVEGIQFYLQELFPEEFGLEENVEKLLEWTPSCFELDKNSDMYEEGDEKAPFFSEAFLYNLLGKEDARTLRCLLRNALGLTAGRF